MSEQVNLFQLHDPIETLGQFEEMIQLMKGTRYVVQQYIRKHKKSKNKQALQDIEDILKDYQELNLT